MKTIEEIFINEKDFARTMEGKVLPFLNGKIRDGYFKNREGLNLHYQFLVNPNEKATVVISHGFCEFTTKYAETVYYFYEMGYSVFLIDHRGHGFSDRQVKGFYKVHIDDFDDYVEDLHEFVEKIVVPESLTEKLYLFAHSMGGGIGARFLEMYPKVFSKAVLSSPLMELNTGKTAKWKIKLLGLLSHLPVVEKMYIPGYHDYDHVYKYPDCSAMSEPRYKYQYDERERVEQYQTSGGTFCWGREAVNVSKKILKNAHLVKIPVILMQASLDNLVMPQAQVQFSQLAADCRLIVYEDCKHEIFNASDDIILKYYTEVLKFFQA